MRYYTEKPKFTASGFGEVYKCDHPVYNECTLIKLGDRGLAIIQQRYDPNTKHTWWGPVDEWLIAKIYIHPGFRKYFIFRAEQPKDGIYPTVPVRKVMWNLRMKPIRKKKWETTFDHAFV